MKKLATLLLAAGMVFAASAPASAVDVKFDGDYQFNFYRGTGFQSDNYGKMDTDGARHRLDLGMTFTASENLSGYFQMRVGTMDWGYNSTSAAFNSEKSNATNVLTARQVYVDWVIPQTSIKVRMGKHFMGLPGGANGKSYIQHGPAAPATGITVNAPVLDNLNVTAYWARLDRDEVKDISADKLDVFGLYANYKLNGFAIAPYVAYASMGEGLSAAGFGPNPMEAAPRAAGSDAYWVGATATVSAFDPFTFKVGAAYGKQEYYKNAFEDAKGFVVDALATYKLGFGTVKALAWYGSGDDKDDQKRAGNMPYLYGRFNGGSVAWNGSGLIDNIGTDWCNAQGTWGIQLGLTGMSFLQGLSHDFTVTYFEGTNHTAKAGGKDFERGNQYLTEEDSAVEVAFNTKYQIYKNLSVFTELGYVFTDFADQTDGYAKRAAKYEDDWKVALGFQYKF